MYKKYFIAFFLSASFIYAQVSNYITDVRISEAVENSPVNITANLVSSDNISSMEIAYRQFGKDEFIVKEMEVKGNTASADISGESVLSPYIEYYIIIYLKDGSVETYPQGVPDGTPPLQIAVRAPSEKSKEILVLSPAPDEKPTPENFLVSLSFMKASDKIDIKKTKLFLNNEDVTSKALIAGDLIILSTANIEINPGLYSFKAEIYDKEGNIYHTLVRNIRVISSERMAQLENQFKYRGNISAETRSENVSETNTQYSNVNAKINASYGALNIDGRFYVTSEEKSNLQPYNRYSLKIAGGDIFEIHLGDAYPRFPSLILNGKRVRGISGEINLGFFNLQTSFGEITRGIEGKLLETYQKENAPLGSNVILIDELRYGNPYGRVELGTFKREIFSVRPSFGRGENFQLGFSYLHGKDDPGSIEFGSRPKENAVFGADLMFALDNKNITFNSQVAFSMNNNDISAGEIEDSRIDSVFGPGKSIDVDPDQIRTIRDILGNFITVNEYLGPLNPQEFASLAAETNLSVNYFYNTLKASYIYRGNDFQSFGQNYLRTDIRGFNISDRVRLLDNQLFISLGLEKLEDNLQNTKIATTSFDNISTSISYFPRIDFPRITLSYNQYKKNNGIDINDTLYNRYMINDKTNRISLGVSYSFDLYVRNSVSFTLVNQKREDESLFKNDLTYNSVSLSVNSFWNRNLTSLIQILFNSTELQSVTYDYVSFLGRIKYKMLEDRLQFTFSYNPSFGDFKRHYVELLADYNLIANLFVGLQARFFHYPGKYTNSITGLSARFSF
ncbi:hypothetical protein ACSSWA_04175 [Melioribacter sp. Ez-97]|uniref:hypothetical protein n=1 Tax=Melioribacter sp. Ez-97 TaxID=3423434 RepID=UPI003ED9BAB7